MSYEKRNLCCSVHPKVTKKENLFSKSLLFFHPRFALFAELYLPICYTCDPNKSTLLEIEMFFITLAEKTMKELNGFFFPINMEPLCYLSLKR